MRLDVAPVPFYEGRAFFGDSSLPLAIVHTEHGRDYPVHRHDFTELVIVYGGAGTHVTPSGERLLDPGDFFVISPGDEHGYERNRGLRYVNVLFDLPSLLGGSGRAGGLVDGLKLLPGGVVEYRRLSAYGTREALSMVTRIDRELFRKERGYELAALASFLLLLATLERSNARGAGRGESTQARVRALAERIEGNSSLPLSASEMAEEARTSVRNFRREFKLATGESPVAFVNRRRVEEARALLRGTDKTVTQIAFLVGFEDSAYFTRVFKRVEGVSPSDYRARR
jgi:AraC family L-rhamnose operon transcriptional activator RhaR/AraC family L-rhamnose operon regulatory protein RhaS